MSRIPTDAEDTDPIDDEFPTLVVEELPAPIAVTPPRAERLAAEANMLPITREEFVGELKRDPWCQGLLSHGGSE